MKAEVTCTRINSALGWINTGKVESGVFLVVLDNADFE